MTSSVEGPTQTRRQYISGNWKMHTTAAAAGRLARAVVAGLGTASRACVAVCPPFPYLALVGELLQGSPVALGAHNLYPAQDGAFTGEVSPTMLRDLGCTFVILGHSERRHILGETDAFINHKVRVAAASGLDVILCVGETLAQRAAGQTDAVLERQLGAGLADLSAETAPRLFSAYEPVWAIGSTGHHATPQQVQEAHAALRYRFGRVFGEEAAQAVVILYGGSVKPENADALLRRPGVDGALIGGASLHADQFLAIIRAGSGASQTAGAAA